MVWSLTKPVCHTLSEENKYFALKYAPFCLCVYVRTSACVHTFIHTCMSTYIQTCVCMFLCEKSVSIRGLQMHEFADASALKLLLRMEHLSKTVDYYLSYLSINSITRFFIMNSL